MELYLEIVIAFLAGMLVDAKITGIYIKALEQENGELKARLREETGHDT
jgi:hypothetical protein